MIPGRVDLCIITLPAAQVEGALIECGAAKVKAAVVFTSGFAEIGEEGRRQQERMAEIAAAHGMALCGPNCLGLINVASKATATFTTALERVPDIPLGRWRSSSQSGALAAFILALMQDDGIGLSHFVTTGNEAALGFADYATYLLDDSVSRVVAGYLEGANGPALVAVARRRIAAPQTARVDEGRRVCGGRARVGRAYRASSAATMPSTTRCFANSASCARIRSTSCWTAATRWRWRRCRAAGASGSSRSPAARRC